MRPGLPSACAIILAVATAAADPGNPPVKPLKMTSPDSATLTYADTCANGGNDDEAARTDFIARMLADKRSKLAKLEVELFAEIKNNGEEPRGDGVIIGDWQQTFHDRDGCGQSLNAYSTFVFTQTGGNTNHLVAKRIVTIDDDDVAGVRTLKLRKIQPIDIRK
jgi:hypothetical protein